MPHAASDDPTLFTKGGRRSQTDSHPLSVSQNCKHGRAVDHLRHFSGLCVARFTKLFSMKIELWQSPLTTSLIIKSAQVSAVPPGLSTSSADTTH